MADSRLEREVLEGGINRAIAKEFRRQRRLVVAEAEKETPDFELLWDEFRETITAALIPPLVRIYDEAIGWTFGSSFTSKQDLFGTLLSLAPKWARGRAAFSARAIVNTTRTVVSGAFATVASTPGMTMGDFKDLIQNAFSLERIRRIAITETTEARFNGVREAQAELNRVGFRTELVWFTRNDERVCPICGPLHGKPETSPGSGVWDSDGIIVTQPAHIGCRCRTSSQLV